MAARGPRWQTWVDGLAKLVRTQIGDWELTVDGAAMHGYCSIVVPVRDRDGASAVLKLSFPDDETEHEHLALRRWGGHGAVRLLRADPHHRALLLERLSNRNLNELWDIQACEIVADLYRALHVPALPQVRSLPGPSPAGPTGWRRYRAAHRCRADSSSRPSPSARISPPIRPVPAC